MKAEENRTNWSKKRENTMVHEWQKRRTTRRRRRRRTRRRKALKLGQVATVATTVGATR